MKTIFLCCAIVLAVVLIVGSYHPVIAEQTGLGGEIIFAKPVQAVIFSHKAHVEGLSMSCNVCHDKIFQMDSQAAEKSVEFNHKGFDKGMFCGACHGKTASAMNTQCTKCHLGVKGYTKIVKPKKTVSGQTGS
ncbi:MAG TPA: c(7)-type cytochrome triheme domain-containing protein [Dissulfurispiraceae bacterium]|nr:c(7)-type cytochrome triheme domain-containing protein [Dissulfurispiraceae bacterium]